MSGKLKCDYLKKYRESIAKEYDIKGFEYEKCNSECNCIGTCPKCEIEVSKLNSLIKTYKNISLPKTLETVDCHTPIDLNNYEKNTSSNILSELYSNPSESTGKIFGIERLRINIDGEGITTLVGMAGCPLHCKYCINKEINNIYNITVDELYNLVLQDELYYNHSKGGICFGGNEPLLQADFILNFIEKVRKEKKNWRIGLETSLSVYMSESCKKLLNVLDYLIIDIKSMKKFEYQMYTDCSDNEIRNLYTNLKYLKQNINNKKYTIKVPQIPIFVEEYDVSESVKDLLQIGFLYKNIKVIDYIVPKGSEIDLKAMSMEMEGDIDPTILNEVDGFIGVDKKLLENCKLEGDISVDADNKEYEENIIDLDIDIEELQSTYEKMNKENLIELE